MKAIGHIEINQMSNSLSHAAAVTLLLAEKGSTVIAALANGRRPLLMVDSIPVGVSASIKRSHPNGMGGTTVVFAADYHGCQLEWMHDFPSELRPVSMSLQVVANV